MNWISTILPLHFHYESKFKVALNESCDYVLFDRCWKFIMDLWKLTPALWVLNKMEKRSRFHSIQGKLSLVCTIWKTNNEHCYNDVACNNFVCARIVALLFGSFLYACILLPLTSHNIGFNFVVHFWRLKFCICTNTFSNLLRLQVMRVQCSYVHKHAWIWSYKFMSLFSFQW